MKDIKDNLILYAVTDRRWLHGMKLEEAVERAIKGGATIVQLREKNASKQEFSQLAASVLKVCRHYKVPLIINDNVDVAIECGADGVHVGQEDMAITEARRRLGCDKIIGVSAHTVEEAVKAEKGGADYLGSGAMFQTGTKDVGNALSPEDLAKITASVSIPVVAIGGINAENMPLLKGTGAAGAAVVSAIFAADDIEGETIRLRSIAEDTFKK